MSCQGLFSAPVPERDKMQEAVPGIARQIAHAYHAQHQIDVGGFLFAVFLPQAAHGIHIGVRRWPLFHCPVRHYNMATASSADSPRRSQPKAGGLSPPAEARSSAPAWRGNRRQLAATVYGGNRQHQPLAGSGGNGAAAEHFPLQPPAVFEDEKNRSAKSHRDFCRFCG